MRPTERIVVFGGIIAAILLALTVRESGSRALAGPPQADAFKLGTVDVYLVIEKLMATEDLKKKREEAATIWENKAAALQKDLQQLEDSFKVLPQSSPQIPEIQKQAQDKQAELQKVAQDRQQDMEKMNSGQLIDAYKKVRDAGSAVGERLGYTHVLSQRGYDKPIETATVATTIQELLARPLVRGIPADDLTKAVLKELKLE